MTQNPKPTAFGGQAANGAVAVAPAPVAAPAALNPNDPLSLLMGKPETGGPMVVAAAEPVAVVADPMDSITINLTPEQRAQVASALQGLDFEAVTQAAIVLMGSEPEKALHQTLDGFLQRLNKGNAGKLFKLFDALNKGVEDADLPKVMDTVMNSKPGAWEAFINWISRKSAGDVAKEIFERICGVVDITQQNLMKVINGMEADLQKELQGLIAELQVFDQLKQKYATHRDHYAIYVALGQAFVAKAEATMVVKRAEAAAKPDALTNAKLGELEAKLQSLKSRALALEGTYTKLPADQQVIQMLEQAGISTLQEVATTSSQRFASIKMTLLALQGTIKILGTQMMAEGHKKLDNQLAAAQATLMKQAVTNAVNAPGDNRAQQAAHIKKAIEDHKALQEIVKKGREANDVKFAAAAKSFKESRDILDTLPQ
jgi:hypothetical protein